MKKENISYIFPFFWIGLIFTTYMKVSNIFLLFSFGLTIIYILNKKIYKENKIKISWWIIFIGYYFFISIIGLINGDLNIKMFGEFCIKYIFLPIIVINLIPKKEEQFEKTIYILKTLIFIFVIYGLIESLFKYNPFAYFITIDKKDWIVAMNNSKNYQCSSVFLHYNYYGIILLIGWILSSIYPYKKINLVYKVLIIEQILVCQSRICWVAFLVLNLIRLLIIIFKKKKISNQNLKIALTILIIIMIIILISPSILNKLAHFIIARFSNIFKYGFKDGSLGQRLGTLMNWPKYYKDNIIKGTLGTGYKSIMTYYMKIYSYFPGYSTADCQWTIFLVETGIIGSIFFIIAFFKIYKIKGTERSNILKNSVIILFLIIALTLDVVSNNIILSLIYFAIIQVIFYKDDKENNNIIKLNGES